MKRINYRGNLENDIRLVEQELYADKKMNSVLKLSIFISCILPLLILMMITKELSISILLTTSIFGVTSSVCGMLARIGEVYKIRAANHRLNFLLHWLEYNHGFVKKDELLAAVKTKEDGIIEESQMEACNNNKTELTKNNGDCEYFSLLDVNNKIIILKLIRAEVKKYGVHFSERNVVKDIRIEEQLYFLENDDIRDMNPNLQQKVFAKKRGFRKK